MSETKRLEQENPLGTKPVGSLLLEFSVPAILAVLVNAIYNVVDQIFIGQGVGYLGNAATTITFPIITILMAFGTMLGSGGSAYAAIRLGEGKKEEAERALNATFVLAVFFGILLAVLALLFLEPLLWFFGATERSIGYARDYASIILIGTPFSLIGPALSSLARTDGKPRLSMYGVLIGAVLNTILDPIYIFVFHWGVKGAALATITSQLISAVVLAGYFFRYGKNMRLKASCMKPDGKVYRFIFTLGLSSGITQGVSCVMQIVINNSLVYYGDQSTVGGDVALSAMGIVMKMALILVSVCIGISIGSQALVGFNYGARKFDRIQQIYRMSVIASTLSVIVGWLVCQLAPEYVLQLFGGGDAQFMAFGVKSMRIFLGGVFCAGFQIISTQYFQATGQPLKASILSMLRQLLLLVPMILILPLFFGLDGVLIAGPVADVGSAVIVALFMVPEWKKLKEAVEAQKAGKEVALRI